MPPRHLLDPARRDGPARRNAARRGQDVIDRAEEAQKEAFGRLPPSPAEVGAEDAAATALEEAHALARDNPRDYAGRRKLLEQVVAKHPGTRASRQASGALDAFHREEAQAEMLELTDAVSEADRLVDAGRLWDASRVFRNYAARWKDTSNMRCSAPSSRASTSCGPS